MRVTEIRPAADADAAQWLLRSDVDWWDLVRYGPTGFDVYVRIAFPQDSGTDADNPSGEAPADAVRAALATLASYTATPFKGYAAIWEGWVSGTPAPRAPRVEIPNRMMLLFTGPVEALTDAPALAWHGSAAGVAQEPHLVWPEDQAWCLACEVDEEIEFTEVVPRRRPRLWLEPCRVLFDECVTGNRLRCTATRPSPSIRSSACGRLRDAPREILACQIDPFCAPQVITAK
jgi:hypothetical protein